MDFRLTPKQEALRKEVYAFCATLDKKKPASYTGIEAKNEIDECAEFHRYCAREFGKKGWLTFGWPEEFGGKGDMMDKVIFSEAVGYYGLPGVDEFDARQCSIPVHSRVGVDERETIMDAIEEWDRSVA